VQAHIGEYRKMSRVEGGGQVVAVKCLGSRV
jgi:hypothetical protein